MVNQLMLWYMIVPVLVCVGVWFYLRKERVQVKDVLLAVALLFVVEGVILAGAFLGARGVATSDTEILNGKVLSKDRKHDTYQESYECRCRNVTVTSGSGKDRTTTTRRECDTCYRTHYTVSWDCETTVGTINIASEDSLSSVIYLTPDPERYTSIQRNDPVSRANRYTNYVQAVPESLFKTSSKEIQQRFAAIVPAYPDTIYDIYRNNHFIAAGVQVPDVEDWNRDLAIMLSNLGPVKQVNAIVVVAKTADANYEYALRDKWEGANKNDVVLIIGAEEYPKIDFVRVLTWSKAEKFKIELRDEVLEIGQVNREQIMSVLTRSIDRDFERRKMADFQYLESEIDPPVWVQLLAVLLMLAAGPIAIVVALREFKGPGYRIGLRRRRF